MSEIETAEQEKLYIAEVKKNLRDTMCQLGYWKGFENSNHTVYALMELAFEISPDTSFFSDVTDEVCSMASEMPERILNNYDPVLQESETTGKQNDYL
jgi:hypothetical protein